MDDATGSLSGMEAAFQIDEAKIRGHVDQVVRGSVEETLNALLDAGVRLFRVAAPDLDAAAQAHAPVHRGDAPAVHAQ